MGQLLLKSDERARTTRVEQLCTEIHPLTFIYASDRPHVYPQPRDEIRDAYLRTIMPRFVLNRVPA